MGDTRPKVGDRLRVTEAGANCAPVREGQIITVHATDYDNDNGVDYVRTRLGDVDEYAYFISLDNVEPVTDEPADLIESAADASPEPTPSSSFAHHVTEAKRLLADTDHTGADVVALAVELDER
ncbi:hypothetical protein [Streptomyces sp. MH60]|uniref:hypothetical protein n=1 Tax=Streptomyces sp. MH60 TaxID=1940758 RepID=UPI000D4BF1E4|nr:hypothetical protein [Streptomyces sp. MH60]PPS86467.1 hypothetical protein BZZ08_03434 [Streptomyces sp. MH60]